MERRRRMKRDDRNFGGSLLFVIWMMTVMAVLFTGYLSMAEYHFKYTREMRARREGLAAAKSIHRSFCEAVAEGNSQAMNQIWDLYEESGNPLEEKEYTAYGLGTEEDIEAEIVLKAVPARETASVSTTVKRGKYRISLKADILLENEERKGKVSRYYNIEE
jgi:hypothetical protein